MDLHCWRAESVKGHLLLDPEDDALPGFRWALLLSTDVFTAT